MGNVARMTYTALAAALFLALSPCRCAWGAGGMARSGKIGDDFEKKNGKISLVDRKKGPKGSAASTNAVPQVADVMKDLADDAVFLKIGDDDKLTWGALREHAESLLKVKADTLLKSAGSDGDSTRLALYATGISRILQKYIRAGVMAYEARKSGIVVSNEVFDAELAQLREKSPKLNAFQYQFATNAVYQRAYVEKFLRPKIKVLDEDVAKLIKLRHEQNLAVPTTNRLFRATLEDVRRRLLKNELSFADAVEEYSECATCSSEGGDCGTWEEDEDELDPKLKEVCFSIQTNVLSDVVETPDAFHLVKIVGRYVPTAKAREEDGEVSSVDVRHIQIDKWTTDPEFTEETARKHIEYKLLSRALKARQLELIKTVPIESVIPLEKRGKKSGYKVFK